MGKKCDIWKCTSEDCGEVFITRQEWDESKIYCPFCKAENDIPERLANGIRLKLKEGEGVL